ncbi:MAG: hypothetical protein HC904_12395 [Blastochloris sp.]|nr:hypothetical protein [Blastochloris sp.]
MSDRDIVIDLVQRLPASANLREIAKEIEFIAGVREGLDELDLGKGTDAEEVRPWIPSWITK